MKPILPFLLPVLICACGQNNSTVKSNINTDTLQAKKTDGGYTEREITTKVVKGYTITIKQRESLADSRGFYNAEHSVNIMFVHYPAGNKVDSVVLENYDDMSNTVVEELSDSLRFPEPAFLLTWIGDSDMPWHEFVAYRNDSLKSIFLYDGIVTLQRKDEWTLEGMSVGRDEIASDFQRDYPFTVSLRTGAIDSLLPPIQYIGWTTVALENIRAYRMTGSRDSTPHIIRKGTNLELDTLYRLENRVRIRVGDSLVLFTSPAALKEKIGTNTAG